VNLIRANPTAKFSLAQELVKSWDFAVLGTSEPHKVTEEEVTMAEAFACGVRFVADR